MNAGEFRKSRLGNSFVCVLERLNSTDRVTYLTITPSRGVVDRGSDTCTYVNYWFNTVITKEEFLAAYKQAVEVQIQLLEEFL